MRLPPTPFTPNPGDDPAHQEEHHRYLAFRKVRHTILRLIGDHYRRPRGTHRSLQGSDLDLTGVTIDGNMNFRGAAFSNSAVDFRDSVFSGGTVDFRSAVFSGGTVDFRSAEFSGGTVDFGGAKFSGGEVHFGLTVFSGGIVQLGNTTGPDPSGLLQAVGNPVPAGVSLRTDWLSGTP